MKALIFDTETTGKWNFKAPYDHPSQPNLMQLALILENMETGVPHARADLLVDTEGRWKPEPGALAVHGISEERADQFGVLLGNACYLFRNLVEQADVVVAHNMDFDRRIMERALLLADIPPIPWDQVKQRCTMKTATPICKIPGTRGFKWPSLEECLQHFTGKSVANAHDAMADAQACRTIHRHLHQMGVFA